MTAWYRWSARESFQLRSRQHHGPTLWLEVLHHLTIHPQPVIASGGQTAWAVRKNNPQLKQLLDEFFAPRAVGSSFGNTLIHRYLENTRWVVNATSPGEMKKFEALSGIFKKYASPYDFDYVMMAQDIRNQCSSAAWAVRAAQSGSCK